MISDGKYRERPYFDDVEQFPVTYQGDSLKVMLKVRADLGSVQTLTNERLSYQDVKCKVDTLYLPRGSTLNGTIWSGSLRNPEWILDPSQVRIEEIHLVYKAPK
jgi:hypothetical protein